MSFGAIFFTFSYILPFVSDKIISKTKKKFSNVKQAHLVNFCKSHMCYILFLRRFDIFCVLLHVQTHN